MSLLTTFKKEHLTQVEIEMRNFLRQQTTDETLLKSMLYSIDAGGKRLRPLLLLATITGFEKEIKRGMYQVAAAVEMIHTYSLIHDDLPAMDDDQLRRGLPTNHVKFGAGMATLAGDGLLTEAFHLLSQSELDSDLCLLLVQNLAKASGSFGMVAGQAADVQAEGKQLQLQEMTYIHQRKTGALFTFAITAGGLLAQQEESVVDLLQILAGHLGLAFQIRDDLLDVTATTEQLGKNVGHDAALNKSTYPALLGVDKSYQLFAAELAATKNCIEKLGEVSFAKPDLLLTLIEELTLEAREK
ncbi:farnesyl-diphosphate synthase [Enterococcus saigonensis]|uniref:Farnesyl diphosphate synthase n=1 Tax=Enterococcus saigonensis TaxID=1805431 RepID=A0A679IKV8_9ENTE|nr:farnesyl diphosphate synthase [Enterococcus saigonensis]BCA85301.1 farnesyl-diphosphate synthase [Enterococcus saigonensis]